jgi:hypothetical protein
MRTDGQTDRQTNATKNCQQNLVQCMSDKDYHVTSQALQYCYHAWKKCYDPSYEMSRSGVDIAANSQTETVKGDFLRGFFQIEKTG